MYRSISVKKILNGYVLTYEQWLEHLPPTEFFMTAEEMKPHAGLVSDVLSYEEAAAKARAKEPPKASPAKKPVVEEPDNDL